MEKIRDSFLQGFAGWILLAQVIHLAAVFADKSFSEMTRWFCIGSILLLAGILLSVAETCRNHTKAVEPVRSSAVEGQSGTRVWCLRILFLVLFLYQLWVITSGMRQYLTGDMLVETAASFLKTDGVYRVNPLTGSAYTVGVPLRIRILGLPSFYGMLSGLLHLEPVTLIRKIVPVVVLMLCYLAFASLGDILFTGKEKEEKKWLFLVLVAVTLSVEDYLYGMDGFNLLYCGYRGTTIRNLILEPYTISLVLRKKHIPVVLCVLAELSIAWTLYGLGVCLLTAVVLTILNICSDKSDRKRHPAKENM